jgi:undecaprenyl-diphosphatase
MNLIQALVYGIIQGIGEFLPISSTAHLILIPWLLKWPQPDAAFDVALHLGTASAVILFFIKDWVRLVRAGIIKPKSTDGKLFWFIVIATIPGGVAGVFLDKYMEIFSNPALIGMMLIIMGIVLYVADKYGRSESDITEIGLKRSIFVGLSQMFAIIPGVSRAGITMSTGRIFGLTREAVARFTFLMSAPIILLDGLYHATSILGEPIDKLSFIEAILTAAIIGAISIKFLLGYLRKNGFDLFVVYRFALGVFVIFLYFIRSI